MATVPSTAANPPLRPLLGTYLGTQRRRVGVLIALLFAALATDLANPLILRAFIDGVQQAAPLENLLGIAGLFFGVALLAQGIAVAEAYVAQNVGLTATNNLRADLTAHLLDLDPDFHHAHAPGELIERVDGDVATLANFFSRFAVQLIGNGLLLVGVLVMLWAINGWIGLTVSGFTFLAFVLLLSLRRFGVTRWAESRQASADLFGFLEERLAGTDDLRANGATGYALQGLLARSQAWTQRTRSAVIVGGLTGNLSGFCLTAGTAAALGLGGWLFLQGAITLGTVYVIFSYTDLLRRPLDAISRQLQDLQQAGAGLRRIGELLGLRPAITDGLGTPLPPGALGVAFDGVDFAYNADAPVLADLSFRLEPGRVLGVLGRTGSGKTTITRLLFRLYDPAAGAIRLGGVDLRETTLADLRTRVGLVTQDIHLFHASVRDNLTFFDRSIPDERIINVLEDLGLDAWLHSLPKGLDTKLAPGGRDLSAGQAQLVAFARVFLRDPSLVILDEASSRLDPATEAHVEHAIDRLLAGRTAIIIAHRLGTVRRADEILILDGGRIVEHGPRAALAADPDSRFAGLLRGSNTEVLA